MTYDIEKLEISGTIKRRFLLCSSWQKYIEGVETILKGIQKKLAILLTMVMLIGLLPMTALAADSSGLTDVQNHWGAESIAKVVEEGLFNGDSNHAFHPDGGMTRAMFVTVLQRMAKILRGPAAPGADQAFSDVSSDDWCAGAVSWAVKAGITSGYKDGHFGPNDLVTREQMSVFFVRFLSSYMGFDLSKYTTNSNSPFADDATIGSWAKESVYLMQAMGLIQGGYDNTFQPRETATRTAAAVIFDRCMKTVGSLTAAKTKPSSDGGDSGSSGSSGSSYALSSVYIKRGDTNMTGAALRSGDQLSVSVSPSGSSYTIRWLVGGVQRSTGSTYTVAPLDSGATIVAEVTGTGSYTGKVTSAATGAVTAVVDLHESDPDKTPVVLASGAVLKDSSGIPVTLPEDAALSLSVSATGGAVPNDQQESVNNAVTAAYPGIDLSNVTLDYRTLDADLMMESGGTSTEIHPVGDTTMTLSKSDLGLAADVDLTDYVFVASHTNVDGASQTVVGTVETIDGVQYVRFLLNGLSRIYIGNVPPLTVTFNTDGGNAIPAQKVKLGGYAVAPANPTKSGYLFAGWDHDLKTENIIKDITVKASWIQGAPAADDRLTVSLNGEHTMMPSPETVTGTGTIKVPLSDNSTYDPNINYTLKVTAVEGAVKYAIADSVEQAYASTGLQDVSNQVVTFDVAATDTNGKAIPAKTTKYIKWLDANGNVLALESASLLIWTESYHENQYDTVTREETKDVNRGLGKVEFYLTDGKLNETPLPDFAGAINGYLNGGTEGYALSLYGSFGRGFYSDAANQSYGDKCYTGIKVVITPFSGESFSEAPAVTASYRNGGDNVDYSSAVSTSLDNGNIVVTCAKPTGDVSRVDFHLTLGGITQILSVRLIGSNRESSYTSVDTWDEALAALAGTEYTDIHYTGSDDVTLTSDLTLAPGKYLSLTDASLTVASGATLTLEGTSTAAADIHLENGSLMVNGTLTTNAQNSSQSTYFDSSVTAAGGIAVNAGGTVQVPAYGGLRLDGGHGGFTVAQNATVNDQGYLYLAIGSDSGTVSFAGNVTVNGSQGYLEVNDGLDLASTGSVTVGVDSRFSVYGGMTLEQGATLQTSGSSLLSGKSYNHGSIEVLSDTLSFQNSGYTVYNDGTIAVSSGAELNIDGTVLVNTGSITGSGSLSAGELNDTSDYNNGLEYDTVQGNGTPDSYSRYKFVQDPDSTVKVTYFQGKLTNQNGGTCALVP